MKFKVGDKVKIIGGMYSVGKVGEIVRIGDKDSNPYLVIISPQPNDWVWKNESELELVLQQAEPHAVSNESLIRTFETGATRDTAQGKLDYEGFTSPLVLERIDEYTLREREIAWAAGLFEGEGCVYIAKQSCKWRDGEKKFQVKLEIKHTDEDVLQRFHAIIAVGNIVGPYWAKKSTKPFWSWTSAAVADVAYIASLFFPYLGYRRRAKLKEAVGSVDFQRKSGISALVLEEYAGYLNKHRVMTDGTLRESDNWKKGIPDSVYAKSLYRHLLAALKDHQGLQVADNHGKVTLEDSLCGIIFNAMGWLHEILKAELKTKSSGGY